eukprot:7823191-Prorocentrum_lima.AAC.1
MAANCCRWVPPPISEQTLSIIRGFPHLGVAGAPLSLLTLDCSSPVLSSVSSARGKPTCAD